MFIEESKEDKVVEQHFVEAQTMQKDAREENIIEAKEQASTKVQVEVQQATKVQVMAKTQRRAMEMKRHESKTIANTRRAILDIITLLEKGIKIPNPK
jgi:RecB family endonuclease NucS